MKSKRRPPAEKSAAVRTLRQKLLLARARAATLEAAAREAKADSKQAKKAFKHARKAAKQAKRDAKALARELKAAAKKSRRRKKAKPALVARATKLASAPASIAPAALPPAIADGGGEGAAGPLVGTEPVPPLTSA